MIPNIRRKFLGLLVVFLILSHCSTVFAQPIVLVIDLNNSVKTTETIKNTLRNHKVVIFNDFKEPNPERLLAYKIAKLNDELNEYDWIDTVVFNGHHGNYIYSGSGGALSIRKLYAIMSSETDFFPNVSRIILRGCYTVTADMMLVSSPIRKLFRNAKIIAGYEMKAWDDKDEESIGFINSILQWETSETVNLSKEMLTKKFFSIDFQQRSALGIWVKAHHTSQSGIYLSTENSFNNKTIIDLESSALQCRTQYQKKNEISATVSNYITKNENQAHLTNNKIRGFYNFFNKYNYCYQLDGKWLKDREDGLSRLDLDDNIRHLMVMLFFENIKNNLNIYMQRNFGSDWFSTWKKNLESDHVIQISPKLKEIHNFHDLNFIMVNKLKDDVMSISLNSTAVTNTSETGKFLNEIVLKILFLQDALVMPEQWMTEENSSALPYISKKHFDVKILFN